MRRRMFSLTIHSIKRGFAAIRLVLRWLGSDVLSGQACNLSLRSV